MRNLKSIFMFVVFLMSNAACSGERVSVDLSVIGLDGVPVSDVKTEIGFGLPNGRGSRFVGYTDENGRLSETRRAAFGVDILLSKPGYYESYQKTGYGDQNLTMELREIKNPIAMHVHRVASIIPNRSPEIVGGKQYGYDLKIGDFTAPYGRGLVSDLLVSISGEQKDFWNKKFFVTIKFSNPLDGFSPFTITEPANKWISKPESFFKSNYLAPEQGYKSEWNYHRIRSGLKSPSKTNFDKSRNYYFRVRTVVDSNGNIKSAHYGKIYGEFTSNLTVYFNPKPNDRNVEFNLIKNLAPKRIIGDVKP